MHILNYIASYEPHKLDDGYEYLVKYVDVSYLHLQWLQASTIMSEGWHKKQMLNKDRRKLTRMTEGEYLLDVDKMKQIEKVLVCKI